MFPHVRDSFTPSHYQTLFRIVSTSLHALVSKDVSPFLVPSSNEHKPSSLQLLVLKCLGGVVSQDPIMGSVDADADQSDGGTDEVQDCPYMATI